ncbi:MAG: type II toxin-antitoxin system VapC family toxin [Gemmatimonadetes bacterium]|nr:type II toxin-antitoxin system VapC family toxin [Gemmatimonadota bacterium]
MIVVDTNVLAYLLIEGVHTEAARAVLAKDAEWIAPPLWRSEFRNLLMLYLRRGAFSLADTLNLMAGAERRLEGGEISVDSSLVLSLALASGCTAYDSEFVALAQSVGVPLVTADRKVIAAFPTTAVSLENFVA